MNGTQTKQIKGCELIALSCAIPSSKRELSSMTEFFDATRIKKFSKMTGVKELRISNEGQTTADLAYFAAEQIFRKFNISPDEIDGLIFVTQTPDYLIAATSCILANRLGLKKSVITYDINSGCSGFPYALFMGGCMGMQQSQAKVLVLGGDTISKIVSPHDLSSLLFGDAGFAALIAVSPQNKNIWKFRFGQDGSRSAVIQAKGVGFRHPLKNLDLHEGIDEILRKDSELLMNGTGVFEFSTAEIPPFINAYLTDEILSPNDFDYLLLHQANDLIIKQIRFFTKFPPEKCPSILSKYGNTSSASIPLALCETEGISSTKEGEARILMVGFGVGLSWGLIDITINRKNILPILETNFSLEQ